MLLRVIVEGHLGVQRRVDAPAQQQLKRLVQVVNARHRRAVLLGQLGVGAGDRVCGLFALQVLQRVDAVIVGLGDDGGAVEGVGRREVVFFGAFGGDVHAVDHDVIAARVQTGQQAVPLALDKLRLNAQLLRDLGGDLDVVADEVVVFIVVGPGCPCALHRNRDGTLGLDLAQQVAGRGLGGAPGGGFCCGRGGGAAAAGGQGQRGGQGQGGQLGQVLHYNRLLCL